jgi:molybdopterin-guanine dinucleotide biosynthesis protein A
VDIALLAENAPAKLLVDPEDPRAPALRDGASCRPSTPATEVSGVVVCGGQSRRMGRDKARLEVAGETLLARVVRELSSVVGEVVLACGPEERYADLGLPLALDGVEHGGPLAGIVAGLEAVRAPRALVVACDMPRLDARLLSALVARAEDEALDVCFLEGPGGIEPLCAVYGRRCLPAMRAALAAGRRQVRAFLGEEKGLAVGRLLESELDEALRRSEPATNLNTPEDLARELERRGEEPHR